MLAGFSSESASGRVAVVTGGAKGLGAAIGKRLLDSGASLAIWDYDEAALQQAIGNNCGPQPVRGYQVDVANAEAVETIALSTVKDFGKIDILVNNAGISGLNFNGWEYPLSEWRRVVEIDLFGVFHCCRSVIPSMITAGYGRIINIASISGKEGNPTATPYASAKAGVMALTKALRKGARRDRDTCQRRSASGLRNRHTQAKHARICELYVVEDPNGTAGQTGGIGGDGGVVGERGMLVLDGCRLRHFGWPRDVLIEISPLAGRRCLPIWVLTPILELGTAQCAS